MARRLRRGLFDTNEEQATQPAGMDPCSTTGSYFGPDPWALRRSSVPFPTDRRRVKGKTLKLQASNHSLYGVGRRDRLEIGIRTLTAARQCWNLTSFPNLEEMIMYLANYKGWIDLRASQVHRQAHSEGRGQVGGFTCTVKELQSLDGQLEVERPGERRNHLLSRSYELRETELGRAAARALHERVLGTRE